MAVIENFSCKEKRILKEIICGLSNKEIAQTLNLSISTVKVYVHSIFEKLDVNNRIEAAVKGVYLFLNAKE